MNMPKGFVKTDMSEKEIRCLASFFFKQLSENVYQVIKSRYDREEQSYVSDTWVLKALDSGNSVAVKDLDGTIHINFKKKSYRTFIGETLGRELL